jgi:hypothetical protein
MRSDTQLVAQFGPNFIIGLADMAVRGGKAFQVGDRFNIPSDHIAHRLYSTGCRFKNPLMPHGRYTALNSYTICTSVGWPWRF